MIRSLRFVILFLAFAQLAIAGGKDKSAYRLEHDRSVVLSGEWLKIQGNRIRAEWAESRIATLDDKKITVSVDSGHRSAHIHVPLDTPSGTYVLRLLQIQQGRPATIEFETTISVMNAAPKIVASGEGIDSDGKALELDGWALVQIRTDSPARISASLVEDLLEQLFFRLELRGRVAPELAASEFLTLKAADGPVNLSIKFVFPESFASAVPPGFEPNLFRVIGQCEEYGYYRLTSSYLPAERTLSASISAEEWQPDLSGCDDESENVNSVPPAIAVTGNLTIAVAIGKSE